MQRRHRSVHLFGASILSLSVLVSAVLLVGALLPISAATASDVGQEITIAQLKYRGGGDWYANPTALPNLLTELRKRTDLKIATSPATVAPGDDDIFLHPITYVTGHGRIRLSEEDVSNLRTYFERGGFMWVDDNYGLDPYFRAEMAKVLPGSPLVELPFDHDIYHSFYDFPEGLPKIHEHDGGPPHGYGIHLDGRMVVFYSFNTDIGDGMEEMEVHNDPPEKHEAALRMGMNVIVYALTH